MKKMLTIIVAVPLSTVSGMIDLSRASKANNGCEELFYDILAEEFRSPKKSNRSGSGGAARRPNYGEELIAAMSDNQSNDERIQAFFDDIVFEKNARKTDKRRSDGEELLFVMSDRSEEERVEPIIDGIISEGKKQEAEFRQPQSLPVKNSRFRIRRVPVSDKDKLSGGF
ncbi:MAG: hypothetical protein LBO73_02935 [Holosporaceae bacterium]|jgi:hypothetical protein|nr:hypothetical protein [Holosporaceae bacterium]